MLSHFEGYIGIDVSKKWLDIATDSQVTRIDQIETAIEAFIEAFINANQIKAKQILVVLESTGGYERLAVDIFSRKGFVVHVAHPSKVKAFARARGRLAKTDALDAKVLRDYGRFIELSEVRELPNQIDRELDALGSRLEQLKEMHHQEHCRQGIALSEFAKRSIAMLLSVIKKEMDMLEEEMLEKIKSCPERKEKYDILKSMKGVGPKLALSLISSVPELGKTNKKEIAALIGVAPITHQSGQKTGKAMIRYGRHGVRKILYMAALVACKHNDKFKNFYKKLVEAGKPKKVAIVAVMRKMIVILNAMVRTKRVYSA